MSPQPLSRTASRHEEADKVVGAGLCPDCYDRDAQVVWNLNAPELWRRTSEAIRKYLIRLAKERGVDPKTVRLAFEKTAEMQRRAAVHYHAIIRLDGCDPNDKKAILPPPPGFDAPDLVDAVEHAARVTGFTTVPHPAKPEGWRIAWGRELKTSKSLWPVTGTSPIPPWLPTSPSTPPSLPRRRGKSCGG